MALETEMCDDKKPAWKKGDILAMPQNLARGGVSVANGLHVFEAEYDPEMNAGRWCYGYTPACELRPATREDIHRLAQIANDTISRELRSLGRLIELEKKLVK